MHLGAAVTTVPVVLEHLRRDLSALRAFLPRATQIDIDDLATSSYGFVACQRDELSPRSIIHLPGMHSGRQAFRVQILHSNGAKPIDDRARYFMCMVTSAIGGVFVMLGEESRAVSSSFRAFVGASKCPTEPAQPFLAALGEIRSRVSVRLGDQPGQPDVDADGVEDGPLGCLDLALEDDGPLAGLAGDDRRCRLAGQVTMPANFDCARNANDADATVLDDETITDPKRCRVKSRRCFEPRETGLLAFLVPLNEGREGDIGPSQCLLLGRETVSSESLTGFPDGLQCERLSAVPEAKAAALVRLNSQLQGGVIKVAECAQHCAATLALSGISNRHANDT